MAGRKIVRRGVPFSRVAGVLNWKPSGVAGTCFVAVGVVAVEEDGNFGNGGGGEGA